MTTYTSPYTGQTVNPSQVGYENLVISANTSLQWPINGNNTNVVAEIIDISATSTGLQVIMPSALEVSTGQSTLIRNYGSNAIQIVDNNLGSIVSIASGISQYIYLTDNTTNQGSWTSVQFGAGVASANAAALAGYGVTAIGNTLNTAEPVTTISSNYTFLPADRGAFYVWSGGAGTLTLPVSGSVGNNWYVTIKNDGTGVLNIALQGADTLDGLTGFQLQIGESLVVVSNGLSFYSYGYGRSSQFFFTQLVLPITGGTVALTNAQAATSVQEYIGALTSNCIIVLPPTVQVYYLSNKTSGTFSLTFKTTSVGAATFVLPQGQTVIAICDGTNVYNSQTSTSGSITSLTLGNGASTNPSLNFAGDTTTGVYLAASGQLGFSVSGINSATLTASGLQVPVGIAGGGF